MCIDFSIDSMKNSKILKTSFIPDFSVLGENGKVH